jgi:hypothetical protein
MMALLSALAAVALGAPAAPALKPHLIFMLGDGELQPALTIPPSPSPARTAPARPWLPAFRRESRRETLQKSRGRAGADSILS